MVHDLLAELAGYRDELAEAERYAQPDRAKLVAAEIDRVSGEIRAKADALENTARAHDENGQDVRAAEARVEARRLRNAVDDSPVAEQPARPPAKRAAKSTTKKPGGENAADSTPLDTAGD